MEQSDQPQRELTTLSTTFQLTIHQKEASQNIPSLVAFMEFLQELQRTIQEEEPKKRNKDYYLHCNFSSGQYTSGRQTDDKTRLEIVLEYLTKIIQDTLRGTSSFMKGKRILLDGDSLTFFSWLAMYLGFYNFLPNYSHDKYCFGSELANFSINTFYVLYEPSPLPDWEKLHRAATMRVRERLRYLYYQQRHETVSARDPKSNNDIFFVKLPDGRPDMNQPLYYTDINQYGFSTYSYHKSFELDEIEHLVSLIVAEEEERLKGFVEALHGTLKVVSSVVATRKLEATSQETDILTTLQSLFAMLSHTETASRSDQKPRIVESEVVPSPLQGAICRVKQVEHIGESIIYHVVLTDPGILPEPCEFTLTYKQGSEVDEVSLQEVERDE